VPSEERGPPCSPDAGRSGRHWPDRFRRVCHRPHGRLPPRTRSQDGANDDGALAEAAPTREGKLHNVCAVPIFAGIPLASLASAVAAARRADYRWASYSAVSGLVMVGSFVLMGSAFGGVPRLGGKGGIFQRTSIASGFGWLTALSLRSLSSLPHP
jgi:hypothetical protein